MTDLTVRFKKPANWGELVNIHHWEAGAGGATGWLGVLMAATTDCRSSDRGGTPVWVTIHAIPSLGEIPALPYGVYLR